MGERDSDSITVQDSGLTHDFWIGNSLYIFYFIFIFLGGGASYIFILLSM